MEEAKKTRGAWEIRVKQANTGEKADAGYAPIPNGGEHRNMKGEKEE